MHPPLSKNWDLFKPYFPFQNFVGGSTLPFNKKGGEWVHAMTNLTLGFPRGPALTDSWETPKGLKVVKSGLFLNFYIFLNCYLKTNQIFGAYMSFLIQEIGITILLRCYLQGVNLTSKMAKITHKLMFKCLAFLEKCLKVFIVSYAIFVTRIFMSWTFQVI